MEVRLNAKAVQSHPVDVAIKAMRLLAAFMLLSAICVPVLAQESDQTFSVHKADGSLFGIHDTQEQAEAAIRTIPGPENAEDAYQYVRYIKDSAVSESGETTITYWMGRHDPLDPDWVYGFDPAITSEEAYAEKIKAEYVSDCGSTQFAWNGGWITAFPGTEGIMEWGEYTLIVYVLRSSSAPTCEAEDYVQSVYRMRRTQCPVPPTSWEDEENACANSGIIATIKTQATQCGNDGGASSGMVGNPCDVKTGEKYESETDFDFGWIGLTRFYHSGVANVSGGFGLGWSDSHRVSLSIYPSAMGLIESNGYTVPFRKVGSEYHATNGSGERIVADGGNWKLHRQDAVYTFDGKGRLVSRIYGDGKGLVYVYNNLGRLDTIASLQGRSIEFQYADASGDALITGISLGDQLLATYTYDDGRLKTVTYPDGGTRTYHYEDTRFPRHLTGITAEDGQRYSTFAYDNKGRVTSSQHAGGVDGVELSYSPAGTVVTDALSGQTTYVMTNAGGGSPKVASVANDAGTETYTYYDWSSDFRRRLDTVTDRDGTQTKHVYGETIDAATGQLASIHTITEAVGLPEQRITQEVRDLSSNRLLATTVGDRETRYAYNSRLQPSSLTVKDLGSGQTRVTTFTYCEAADVSIPGSTCPIEGLLKTVDGPRTDISDVVSYAYYASDHASCGTTPAACQYRKGDLWKITNALGQVTEVQAYDEAGRPLSVIDPNGVLTDFEYHARGWLTAQKARGADNASESDDRIARIEYWPTGLVKDVTDPDGGITAFTYDAAQRLTGVSDSAGNTIHYVLDGAGNRLQEDTRDPSGTLRRTLSRLYDQLGQLETLADAQANPTDWTYDADGNPHTVTDALGRVTEAGYDPLNRIKQVLSDVGGIEAQTHITYDALDNPLQVTDPKGLHTTYTYNGFGELTQQGSPDTGVTQLTRDAAGNVATRVDARGVVETHAYDALNRLMAVQYPTPGSDVAFTYDVAPAACQAGEQFPVGRLSSMIDGSGQTSYCYNRFGEMTRKVQQTNGQTLVVRYAYTIGGRLASITYPDGTVVDYVRDALGRTTEVGVATSGGSRQVLLTGATYLPFGPSTGWQYGNGRSLARSYDLDYRPVGVVDSDEALKLAFGYDPVGHLTALSVGSQQAVLDYDALGRLTHYRDAPTNAVIDQYSYDATGNRLSFSNSAGTAPYAYPLDSHRLTSIDGIARSYDQVGNTIAIGGTARQFVYDDRNRMVQVKQGGVVTRNYAYNGKGERVRHWLGVDDSLSVYNESGQWLGDYDASGLPKQQVVWMDDMPVGVLANGSLHYIEPDHLGTPRLVVDAVRDVPIWRWDASGEVFGNTVPNQDPDGDAVDFVFDMRFPGQRYDAASGFNYNYFRDYEPGIGRYVQSDPIGLDGGVNTYGYVGGNPVSYKDSLGLMGGDDNGPQGKRNLSVGGYNKHSNPQDVERAIEEARKNGASKRHVNALRALLKVIKRGGTRSFLPLWFMNEAARDRCLMGDPQACADYCALNSESCEEIQGSEQYTCAVRSEGLVPDAS